MLPLPPRAGGRQGVPEKTGTSTRTPDQDPEPDPLGFFTHFFVSGFQTLPLPHDPGPAPCWASAAGLVAKAAPTAPARRSFIASDFEACVIEMVSRCGVARAGPRMAASGREPAPR